MRRCATNQRGDDIVAVRRRSSIALYIEAKGETSNRPTSKRYGKAFSRSQCRDHVANAFYTAARMMVAEGMPKGGCMQRVYRCKVGTPKTENSKRDVAIPKTVQAQFIAWRELCRDTTGWVFPTEKGDKPVSKDNTWGWSEGHGKASTGIKKLLDDAEMGWVNFQVLRRTHASISRGLDIHPKTVADQLGHTLDCSTNIYTNTPLEQRLSAVETFAAAIGARVEHETHV